MAGSKLYGSGDRCSLSISVTSAYLYYIDYCRDLLICIDDKR